MSNTMYAPGLSAYAFFAAGQSRYFTAYGEGLSIAAWSAGRQPLHG